MKDVVFGQDAAIAGLLAALGGAVLQPFLGGLIAADVEVPGDLRHVLEPAVGVDRDAAELGVIFGLVRDAGLATAGEADALLYKYISSGALPARKVGKRTLVLAEGINVLLGRVDAGVVRANAPAA